MMKYIKLFESESEEELRQLEQFFFLWKNGIEDESTVDFKEFENGWDLVIISTVGEIGFDYEGEDSAEWDGDSWDVTLSYSRKVGDFIYRCWMRGGGRGPHDDIEVDELYDVIDITKNKIKKKNEFA